MKHLHIECNMGAAGDMLCGALLELFSPEERATVCQKLNGLLTGVTVQAVPTEQSGIVGTHFDVHIEHEEHYHHHTAVSEIEAIIDGFDLDDKTKADAKAVYALIAAAESRVHGKTVADVHLHEVGAKDAIMDVTAACWFFNQLQADSITVSPVVTGFGSVQTAHGMMPVPAPATAELLKGIVCEAGEIPSELCTPTGAALLRYFADETGVSPQLAPQKIGYGMGSKRFEKPNCVRMFLSETDGQTVYELRCQVDDMTGEEMGYCLQKLLSLGAKDAYVQSITMKKSRPGMLLTAVALPQDKDFLTAQLFKHTTTLGVRQVKCYRAELTREITEADAVHIKRAEGFGVQKEKAEFDDLVKFAEENDISVYEARKNLLKFE